MTSVVDLIEATVRIEQPLASGQSTVGTGFIVASKAPDGAPKTILITANHVLERMPGDKAKVGFRVLHEDGGWRYAPLSVRIRDAEADPLWTRHPTQDIAALEIPSGLTRTAVPLSELPRERALATLKVDPGDEMMVLGYPHGYSANAAGFPILRAGKVASYPLSPADHYPTYMLDFSVFAGNSGGPVFMVLRGSSPAAGAGVERVAVTGVLTQQVKLRGSRLEIGNVTQADFISETVSLLEGEGPVQVTFADGALPVSDPEPTAGGAAPSQAARLRLAWDALVDDAAILARRLWIVVRDWALDLISADPRRT